MDRNALRRMLLGQGMAGQAADRSTAYPQWQAYAMALQEQGMPAEDFDTWFARQQQAGVDDSRLYDAQLNRY